MFAAKFMQGLRSPCPAQAAADVIQHGARVSPDIRRERDCRAINDIQWDGELAAV